MSINYPTSAGLRSAVGLMDGFADYLEREGRFSGAETVRLDRDALLQLANDLDAGLVRYETVNPLRHDWIPFRNLTSCARCGTVRNDGNLTAECVGVVRVVPR